MKKTFDGDRVRAGTEKHVVRYVLGISLVLAIVALSAILVYFS